MRKSRQAQSQQKLPVGTAGNTGIAGGQMAAGGKAGSGSPSLGTVAARAPAPLAAAPEQALKAEVSETASEPDLLFAPDFIISQVPPSGMAESVITICLSQFLICSHWHACHKWSTYVCSEVVYFQSSV